MQREHHFGGLDLIRFFAAFYVMVFHLAVVSWTVPDTGISPNYGSSSAAHFPELWFLETGWVGIEIFFVLSGLVIAQSANGKSAYSFLRGRVGRLVPSIWICGTATAALLWLLDLGDFQSITANYLRTLIVYRNGPWVSGVYWTLAVEIIFYATIFVILSLNAFRKIEGYAMLLGGGSSIYLVGVIVFGWHVQSANHLLQHGCFFSLGILIWICSSLGFTAIRVAFSGLMTVAGVLEIVFVSQGHLDTFSAWIGPVIWLACVATIYGSVWSGAPGNMITRQAGLITYPLYLIHVVLGAAILRVSPWTGRYAALAAAITGSLIVSSIVVKFEKPLRNLLLQSMDMIVTIRPNGILKPFFKSTNPLAPPSQ